MGSSIHIVLMDHKDPYSKRHWFLGRCGRDYLLAREVVGHDDFVKLRDAGREGLCRSCKEGTYE